MNPLKSSVRPRGKSSVALWTMLKEQYPDAYCECQFDWLKIPTNATTLLAPAASRALDSLRDIRNKLVEHCDASRSTQKNVKKRSCVPEDLRAVLEDPSRAQLEFDFFIPSLRLAIEFDEKQHFSAERAVSLRAYPSDFHCSFDVDDWISRCDRIQATDPDPIYRDWQRAYRDSVRDVLAESMEIRMFRFAYDMPIKPEQLAAALGCEPAESTR